MQDIHRVRVRKAKENTILMKGARIRIMHVRTYPWHAKMYIRICARQSNVYYIFCWLNRTRQGHVSSKFNSEDSTEGEARVRII